MEFPEVVRSTDVEEEAAGAELGRYIRDLGIEFPFVIASIHGQALSRGLADAPHPTIPPEGAGLAWADDLGADAHRDGVDAIVAVGGGRVLDLGKLAAARAGVSLVSVPTQLSHDGICSPVAVVPNEVGASQSLGAIAPRLVFLSTATLATAPERSLAAGIGDLLANVYALKDWTLATEHGLESIDDRAWNLSVQSLEMIEKHLESGISELVGNISFLDALADALVLSGMAMICSGTSRPASGGEHEISHAIDELLGGRAMHGAQVAFGCIVSAALYEEDVAAFMRRLESLGLPFRPEHLGMSVEDVVSVLLHAPATRPGRFTILEEAALDEAGARELVQRVWAPGK